MFLKICSIRISLFKFGYPKPHIHMNIRAQPIIQRPVVVEKKNSISFLGGFWNIVTHDSMESCKCSRYTMSLPSPYIWNTYKCCPVIRGPKAPRRHC